MIYQKRGMWKSTYLPQKFHSYKEAEKAEAEHLHLPHKEIPEVVQLSEDEELSPLERLRGHKICEECDCDPCECEEEWNSVEETSSTTESSTEDHS
jgi:hypothetical protein